MRNLKKESNSTLQKLPLTNSTPMDSDELFSLNLADKAALSVITTAAAASATASSVTVATLTSAVPAWGVAGWLGFTTTTVTTIACPIAGAVAVGGALAWGALKVTRCLRG